LRRWSSRTRTETAATPTRWGPAWRREAAEWIRARVQVTGAIEDVRIKPWAAVLRVPTADGLLYFKEAEPTLAHEHRLIEILARRRPELVTEVVAWDEQGRMLMRDGGEALSELLDRNLEVRYWEEALPLYAELQIAAMADADELRAAGAFDRRSEALPPIYEELMATPAPGLSTDEYERLRALVPDVERACAELAASAVPETINNDDFTNGSIFVRDGAYRFLDWGDSCVSHPFMTLTVTLRVIELRHGLPHSSPEIVRVRDAYLEPFTGFDSHETLARLAGTARRYGQICRVALRAENPHWDDPEELGWSLRLLLDPEAWRDWVSEDEQPPRQGPVS
jgi:Phosphotransferase enzyme family